MICDTKTLFQIIYNIRLGQLNSCFEWYDQDRKDPNKRDEILEYCLQGLHDGDSNWEDKG